MILGDQLDPDSAALSDFDPARDVIVMAEVAEESRHVWSSQPRTAYFLAAMRHFRDELLERGYAVSYLSLGTHRCETLSQALRQEAEKYRPDKIVMVEPGDWRIERMLAAAAQEMGITLAMREDTHFMISRSAFAEWAGGYRQLRMEYFYRMMRKRYDVLMNGNEPRGDRWNFDAENRGAFGREGPTSLPARLRFKPDGLTRDVIKDVQNAFPSHPGTLDHFDWPVTRAHALDALRDFIDHALPHFGQFQDAMWTDQPFLHHSLISAALNVKLLNPREVIHAAGQALEQGDAPIEAVEGFIRQVLGWREFIRGVYWLDMPGLREANHFGHQRALPAWYWTGETHMNCMRQVITQTLRHGYAHHIQRLMVTGIWALLAEIEPSQIEDWYLAVYVDAVEWVELPNVAGMAIYANAGRFTSKPYIASGQYIKRMSNYCDGCRYRPDRKTGAQACPFTTLYWHFLDKHETELAANPRTSLMVRNIARLAPDERDALRIDAQKMLGNLDSL
jgi:deoxyribodipyrimidine photolyase-related protein